MEFKTRSLLLQDRKCIPNWTTRCFAGNLVLSNHWDQRIALRKANNSIGSIIAFVSIQVGCAGSSSHMSGVESWRTLLVLLWFNT